MLSADTSGNENPHVAGMKILFVEVQDVIALYRRRACDEPFAPFGKAVGGKCRLGKYFDYRREQFRSSGRKIVYGEAAMVVSAAAVGPRSVEIEHIGKRLPVGSHSPFK